MLCDICKQNVATVHLTQMVGGKTKKVDLCEACSKEKGVDDPTGFSLADLLLGLGAAQEMAQAAAGTDLKCPTCGFTQADFKKTGRLGRNVKGFPFPGWAKKADRVKALETIRPAVENLPQMAGAFSESMDNFSAMDKQILVERHLISREHAARAVGSGLVLNKEETLCVMINEEDHLRMQALRPGLQLRSAWLAIDQVDTALERRLDYAYS